MKDELEVWTPKREKEILEVIKSIPDMDNIECLSSIFQNVGGGISCSNPVVIDDDSINKLMLMSEGMVVEFEDWKFAEEQLNMIENLEESIKNAIGTIHNRCKRDLKILLLDEFPSPIEIMSALENSGRNYLKLDGKTYCTVYWRTKKVPNDELGEIWENIMNNFSSLLKMRNKKEIIENIKKLTNNSIHIEQIKL